MKVLIKESQPLIAIGMHYILKDEFKNVNVNMTTNTEETLAYFDKLNYDLLILDTELSLEEMKNLIELIKMKQENIKILVCGNQKSINNEFHYISMGANGFITKSSSMDQILMAINLINAGQLYLSQKALLWKTSAEYKKPSFENQLSRREFEVFKLIVNGKTVNGIAESLQLKQTTISTIKRRIMAKLQVANVVELVKLASQYGYN